MNHPFERIHGPMTRKQLLRRAAVGGATLSVPGILAACGGGGGIEGQQAPTGAGETTVAQELADQITVSNWPFYIDQNDDATSFPTLDEFTEATGVKVNYLEDINSNEEFFGEIQAPLSRGQGIDRDIIVPTAWLAARLLDLGYLQKLDKSAIPNISNLEDTLASPPWDPNRDYSLPWQSYITGVGYDPKKVGGEITSVEQLLDPALKGKVTMLDSMEDTAALFMLEMGGDVANPDQAMFNEICEKLKKAVDDGQIRQFTGQRLHRPARRRRRVGVDRLVGRHRHSPGGQPEPRVQDPRRRRDLVGGHDGDSDGRRRLHRVDVHELLLRPGNRRQGCRLRELHHPGEGHEGGDREDRPGARRGPADLPVAGGARKPARVQLRGDREPRVPGAVAGRDRRVATRDA